MTALPDYLSSEDSLFHISIDKAKTKLTVDPSKIDDNTVQYLIALGLKVALNARMTGKGFTGLTKMNASELTKAHADSLVRAKENLEDIYAGLDESGKLKHSRGRAKSTIPAAVRAEAMRLAKNAIKDAVRNAGFTPSHWKDSVYTSKAKEYIENDTAYIEQARQNIEARKTPQFKLDLDLSALGPATAKKAKPKSTDDLPIGAVKATHKPPTHASH